MRNDENSIGEIDGGPEKLHTVMPEWLEDSNFLQLFGGLTETINVQPIDGDRVVEEDLMSVRGEVNEVSEYFDDESDESEKFHDSDYSLQEDDDLFDENVDESVEFASLPDQSREVKLKGKNCEIDCMNSDDDASVNDSDEDVSRRGPTFNSNVELKSNSIEVGMFFNSKEEFKEAIQKLTIQNGKTIKFVKNDKRRCRVICRRTNCPFFIYISKHDGSTSCQIRSLQEHTCTWNYHSKTLNSTLIAKKFVNKIRINPQLKCTVFRREVIDELKMHVSKVQAKKTLQKAREMIHMNEEEQFNKIWDYCLEIANTNYGTTISIHKSTDTDLEGKKRFVRLYVCFDACKRGFFAGCRSLVGVDGCFLKGHHGGQLLTAVTLDGNNKIFPIAWVVVEAETKSSWEWFLDLLGRDLKILENQHNFTFISDNQKELLPAFEKILSDVSNRFCVRHLHQNFKLAGFSGIALKSALWAAAKATTPNQFLVRMQELEKINVGAFRWLNEKSSTEWSRVYFNFSSKCDTLLNNMCECFNALILDAREMPLISMLESIRVVVMTRMLENKEKAMRWGDKLCPKAKEVLGKNIQEAGSCIGVKSDDNHYEIRTMYGVQYIVGLEAKTCSCRRWELTGLSCPHVCAAVHMEIGNCEEYVDQCYYVETYRKIYECNIRPVNDPEEWPRSEKVLLLPPRYNKSKRGRPPKMRRRAPDEQPSNSQRQKLGRSNVVLHCSKCKQSGHNVTSCNKINQRNTGTQPQLDIDITTVSQPLMRSTQGSSNKELLVYQSRRRKST